MVKHVHKERDIKLSPAQTQSPDQEVSEPLVLNEGGNLWRPALCGTSLARQMESVYTLLPREIAHHPNAPRSPAEFVAKLLAPRVVQTTTPVSPLTELGPLLTVAETSRLLKCSTKTVWLKISSGEIPVIRSQRIVRVPESSITALLTVRSEMVKP